MIGMEVGFVCRYLFAWIFFFFSSRRRHTISLCDWSSDVCSSDLHLDKNNTFLFSLNMGGSAPQPNHRGQGSGVFHADMSGNQVHNLTIPNTPIKFYSYRSEVQPTNTPGSLSAPYGENLVSVIISNSSFKSLVQDIFRSKGF